MGVIVVVVAFIDFICVGLSNVDVFDFGREAQCDSILHYTVLSLCVKALSCIMSQVIFGSPYDSRADVYSFGIVMAEILCRRVVGSPMTTEAGKRQWHARVGCEKGRCK